MLERLDETRERIGSGPVIAFNVRLPADLHERMVRVLGRVAAERGRRVSQNTLVVAALEDGLAKLQSELKGEQK